MADKYGFISPATSPLRLLTTGHSVGVSRSACAIPIVEHHYSQIELQFAEKAANDAAKKRRLQSRVLSNFRDSIFVKTGGIDNR